MSNESTPIIPSFDIVERRPFLFAITPIGSTPPVDNSFFTAYIRTVKFDEEKVVMEFLEDKPGIMFNVMRSMTGFQLDYLTNTGKIESSVLIKPLNDYPRTIWPADVDQGNTEYFACRKLIWNPYLIQYL